MISCLRNHQLKASDYVKEIGFFSQKSPQILTLKKWGHSYILKQVFLETVFRLAFEKFQVDFVGCFFNVHLTLPETNSSHLRIGHPGRYSNHPPGLWQHQIQTLCFLITCWFSGVRVRFQVIRHYFLVLSITNHV